MLHRHEFVFLRSWSVTVLSLSLSPASSLSLSLFLSRCPCIAFDLLPPFLFLFSSFPDPYTPPSRYTPSVPLFLLGKVYVKIHRVSPRSVRRVASAIVSKATRRHFEYKKALPPPRSIGNRFDNFLSFAFVFVRGFARMKHVFSVFFDSRVQFVARLILFSSLINSTTIDDS